MTEPAFIGRTDLPPIAAGLVMPRYCSVHRDTVGADVPVVLIDALEQASGPGIAIHACQPCVTRHRITPFAERRTPPLHGVPPRGIQRAP